MTKGGQSSQSLPDDDLRYTLPAGKSSSYIWDATTAHRGRLAPSLTTEKRKEFCQTNGTPLFTESQNSRSGVTFSILSTGWEATIADNKQQRAWDDEANTKRNPDFLDRASVRGNIMHFRRSRAKEQIQLSLSTCMRAPTVGEELEDHVETAFS